MINYVKLKDDLFFINQIIEEKKKEVKEVNSSVHHIFVIDCSGSMDSSLPEIRKDLHNKISTLLKINDSITLAWFSGANEHGVILEDYRINSSVSLEKVRELINRHLTSRGLTAFKGPLEEVKQIINRVNLTRQDVLHSLFFLTDGNDNCSSHQQIIKAVIDLKNELNSATIVEYGWYCNKELMNEMSKQLGGVHKFSQDFQDFEPYIEKQFKQENKQKRTYVPLEFDSDCGVIFNITDSEVVSYNEEKGKILFNSNIGKENNVYYFSKLRPIRGNELNKFIFISSNRVEITGYDNIIPALYASMFAFSRNSDYNMISEILKFLGDANFIKIKGSTFGTQKINELEAKFLEAVNDVSKRYVDGYNPSLEPSENAYCVMDLIEDLMSSEENLWFPRHTAFSYERIGRKTTLAKKKIGDEDIKNINELLSKNDLDAAKNKLSELEQKQEEDIKFIYKDEMPGFQILDLVWNNSRANLSVQVNYQGHVELPANKFNLPKKFPTNIFRNYTLIKDGVIHTYQLPVSLSQTTFNKLQLNDLLKRETYESGKIYVLDFSELPVVNRSMVKSLSAKDLFINQYELTKLQASNTVFNHFKKMTLESISKDFSEQYGIEAAEWLKGLGLLAYGFNPKKTTEKSEEEIEVNTLEIKLDKLTIPNTKKDFEKILDKIEKKQDLAPREALLLPAIKEFKSFQKLNEGIQDKKILENWLFEKSRNFRKQKAKLMNEISRAKFLTIIGKTWFNDFKNRSENEMTLKIDDKDIRFIIEDKLEKIKI